MKIILAGLILAYIGSLLTTTMKTSNEPTLEEMEEFMMDPEHLKEDIKNLDDMDDEEIEKLADKEKLYYFKLHDTNKDNKLDGLEILHGMQHSFKFSRNLTTDELNRMIEENILRYDDDKDGTISHAEFFRRN
ncbi:uncharacterized protein TRIADDRAFT_58542 [Trichoplax adhaerens]|uniref:EF-hand domain-containing protein n=1 Tax=Trichoplax adhaerens TaxID=10228 RepID=B3S2Z7_TRIAD|nr:hypothetical protein TRIADDRAFT_58542 [Trichoplax adhaerens]EDV22877.1 hypothetical protein TRIADDRAFT_58542 [Trichoplax adhaerens]|eukprot:XP_002114743.1 hypothetical protein TRIADDRAFT_58542 [Trichoplax adhaerens]